MSDYKLSRPKVFMWNHLSKLFDYGLTYLLSILLARTLMPAEYGIYVALMSFTATLIVIAGFGIDETLNKYIPKFGGSTEIKDKMSFIRSLFTLRVLIVIVILVIVFLFHQNIEKFLHIEEMSLILPLLSLTVASQSLTNFFINYRTAEFKTKLIFFVNISIKLGIVVTSIVLVFLQLGLLYFIMAITVFSILAFAIFFLLDKSSLVHFSKPFYSKEIVRFSITVWMNALLTMVLGRHSDVLLINYFLKDSRLVGYYDIAFSICIILEYIFAVGFVGIGLSFLSKVSDDGKDKLNDFRIKMIKYHQFLILPAGVFLYFYATEVVTLLFSNKYIEAVPILRVYLIFTIFAVAVFGSGTNIGTLLVIGREKIPFYTRLIVGIFNLSINIIVIQIYGISGAVLVTGIAYLLAYLSDFIFASRILGFRYDYIFLVKVVLITFCSLGIVSLIDFYLQMNVLITGSLFVGLIIFGYYSVRLDVELNERIQNFIRNRLS